MARSQRLRMTLAGAGTAVAPLLAGRGGSPAWDGDATPSTW